MKQPFDRPLSKTGKTVHVRAGMNLAHAADDHPLHRLLAPVYGRDSYSLKTPHHAPHASFWPAHFHRLSNVTLFQNASAEHQEDILRHIHVGLLKEAYFIEKLGMAFGAKMLLLSETTEERLLYASLIADESHHLVCVGQFLDAPEKRQTDNPFHQLLEEIIESAHRPALLFVIQVILEGWGLTHYRHLASHCAHLQLKEVLDAILIDEARHHGSGRILLKHQTLDADSIAQCKAALSEIFSMVKSGPQMVLQSIEQTLGALMPNDKIRVFEELHAQEDTQRKLDTLKNLVAVEETHELLRWGEDTDLFKPMAVKDCV